MRKRIFACMMFLLYMVSLLCISVSAVGINAETEQIDASNLNELSVRLVVNAYFEQRLAYLRGEGDAITAANVPMGNDEAEHKACLETNNITVVDSAVTLDTIECWGNRAFVIAAETAVFLIDGEAIYETILHTITIYNDAENTLLLQSDAYIENVSAFASCSYIPPDREPPVEQQALAGGRNCLVDMAATQIGYTACSDGYTKYGAWYGQLTNQNASKSAWCAMFVSWCANQANIPTSILPCNWGVWKFRSDLNSQGRYYRSNAYGGTYTPKAGDIFFQDGTPDSPGHVGIVSAVTSSSIWIIDGNYTNRVENREIMLSDSSLVAFGDPAYITSYHTASSTWTVDSQHHWHVCVNCGLGQFNKDVHVMSWNETLNTYCCSDCGFGGFEELVKSDKVEGS